MISIITILKISVCCIVHENKSVIEIILGRKTLSSSCNIFCLKFRHDLLFGKIIVQSDLLYSSHQILYTNWKGSWANEQLKSLHIQQFTETTKMEVAGVKRLELSTFGVTSRRSNQLSYTPATSILYHTQKTIAIH